jgi:hypothetical protein
MAWTLSSDVETCCRISYLIHINCADNIYCFNSKILREKLTEITTTQAVYYNVILRRVRAIVVAVETQEYYILCVCVCVFVALGIQREMRMRHTVICGLSDSSIISLKE